MKTKFAMTPWRAVARRRLGRTVRHALPGASRSGSGGGEAPPPLVVTLLVAGTLLAGSAAEARAQETAAQPAAASPPGEAVAERLRADELRRESRARFIDLVHEARAVSIPTQAEEEYLAASDAWREILAGLDALDYEALSVPEQVDVDLLRADLRTRVFDIDSVGLFRLHPVSYIALGRTNRLFVRPGAIADRGVREAVRELERLPAILENGKKNLTNPARVWTENAVYQTYYARLLLTDYLPTAPVDDPGLRQELLRAGDAALRAVDEYERWLERELLPRSNRPPAWDPRYIEHHQRVGRMIDLGIDDMLRIAEAERASLRREMEALADSIHPSGDLRTVWENMKDEAPPWEGVLPMAQSFVDIASDWLRNEGSHVVTIPDYVDYGARITPPMARRTLSFGGATMGPTVAGRQSGYYILTPLEERLTEAEKASRIRSYNPYWTNVISYHEWLGHNVQLAAAAEHGDPVLRKGYRSYFSQAWSFYLEKLLEDEGFFRDRFDYLSALKHRMARLQMRMWRVQRILTKLRMARGEMTFEQAVQAYIDEIGMEPTNAFIEVQRDSQTPSPPGAEIIGELVLLELRDEYQRRLGPHYSLRAFNDQVLVYGDIPVAAIRRLMFDD